MTDRLTERGPRSRADKQAEIERGKRNERHIAAQVNAYMSAGGMQTTYHEDPDPLARIDGRIHYLGRPIRLLEAKARSAMKRPDGYLRVETGKMDAIKQAAQAERIPALLAYGFADRILVFRYAPTVADDERVSAYAVKPFSEGDLAHLIPMADWHAIETPGWVEDPAPATLRERR